MVLFNITVLAVADLNYLISLHTSVSGIGWVSTAYTTPYAALLVLAGAVSDRLGAHQVFRAGVALFGGRSLLCAAPLPTSMR